MTILLEPNFEFGSGIESNFVLPKLAGKRMPPKKPLSLVRARLILYGMHFINLAKQCMYSKKRLDNNIHRMNLPIQLVTLGDQNGVDAFKTLAPYVCLLNS